MPLISLFKFVNWITGTPHAIEDGVASAFTLSLQQQIIDAMNQAPFLASGPNHRAGFVPDPGAVAGTTKFLREDGTWAIVASDPFLNAAKPFFTPQGRLTWSTTEVVMTTSYSAQSTLYYYPYVGSLVPYFDGSSLWNLYNIGNSSLNFALDSNSGHTGYHQAGKIFDVFFDYNGGTGRLVTSPAWTSDSARADAIVRQNGLWLNNASIVCRFGTGSGDTATFSAKTLTYLGSFYCTANGQSAFIYGAAAAGGTAAYFALWNCYNRRPTSTIVKETTDSWTRAAVAIGPLNSGGPGSGLNNRISFLYGLPEDPFYSWCNCLIGVVNGTNGQVGVGLNSTTTFSGSYNFSVAGSFVAFGGNINMDNQTVQGWNYFQALESAQGAGTNTFYGDNGVSYMQQGTHGIGWF